MSSTHPVAKFSLPPLTRSLSAKLLVLTVAFVMLAEVLIYCPSIGRFRLVYLESRLAAAHLAMLALEATPNRAVSEEMAGELMDHVGAYAVSMQRPDSGRLMLMIEKPGKTVVSFDLRDGTFFGLIRDAFVTLASDGSRIIRAVGPSPKDPNILVEVVLSEGPMRTEMIDYSGRILGLSLVISLFTAAFVYLSLHRLLVRPMRRITTSMVRFRRNPEDASRDLVPSARDDEMGLAEQELRAMQEGLRAALLQKTRLAALGIAVTKINHDLRNILSTAFLMSDRLTGSDDPDVRRLASPLLSSINRAVSLCAQTLNYSREGPLYLEKENFGLKDFIDEVAEGLAVTEEGETRSTQIQNELPPELEIEADREQLFRVFHNLLHNALEVGSSEVRVRTTSPLPDLAIEIEDNGPGLPPRARDNLFKPFAGSGRKGGTGLGLAIAQDIMRAHGGDISLVRSDEGGTIFRLTLSGRSD